MNEHLKNLKNRYSADDWRTGKNLRGETYHLWLTELKEKYDMEYPSLNLLYEDATKRYKYEQGIEDLGNRDYVFISRQIEDALKESMIWPHKITTRKRKRCFRGLIKKLFGV